MLKHKTSVLFVNNSGKERKPVQVPTVILLSWKKYLIALIAIIVLLCLLLGFLVFKQTSNFYLASYKAQVDEVNQLKKEVNVEKVKASFRSIDQSMKQINEMLAERGLQQLKLENAGGPEEFDLMDINGMAAFYETEVSKMEGVIRQIPLGLPHFGEQTSGFGYRYNPFGSGGMESHKGLDFRGTLGDAVKATADGVIDFAGVKGGYGKCVIIRHKNGFHTLYGHLSAINVKEKHKVSSGDKIGELGSTGRSTGPHLHYEVWMNGERVNPERFTKR